jgi:hypothetical protein
MLFCVFQLSRGALINQGLDQLMLAFDGAVDDDDVGGNCIRNFFSCFAINCELLVLLIRKIACLEFLRKLLSTFASSYHSLTPLNIDPSC